MRTLDELLIDVPAFAGLTAGQRALIGGCAMNARFARGEYLMREAEPANTFYVIRHGTVAIETFVPARGPMTLETLGEGDLLARNLEHPRWDDVAERCLTCGNCTLVCPTCFCSAVEDETDLTGEEAGRFRVWDTCFSVDYSFIHGGAIRPTGRSRYRQWMTHKLGTWHDQFGSSGCVGCGRCITWCPVGIDVTEELTAIRAGEEVGVADH